MFLFLYTLESDHEPIENIIHIVVIHYSIDERHFLATTVSPAFA
jgi:hypothetical protein